MTPVCIQVALSGESRMSLEARVMISREANDLGRLGRDPLHHDGGTEAA
jgi:hypothetical protein